MGEAQRYVPKPKVKYVSKADRAAMPADAEPKPSPEPKPRGDRKGIIRQEAAVKAVISLADIKPAHAEDLREYVQLLNELDEAEKISQTGTKSKREKATQDKSEISRLIIDNQQNLLKAGLDVGKLNLINRVNRNVLLKERPDLFPVPKPPKTVEAPIKTERALKREAFMAKQEQRAAATKDYLAVIERTNQLHAGLMRIRRELAHAKKSGSESEVQKWTSLDADTTKAYVAGREKIKIAERSLKDAGIEPSDKRFATQAARESLYAEKPTLKPKVESRREERVKESEALEMGEDENEEPVLGYLPGPDDIKGDASREFMKLTDADYDNVGKRETPPPIATPDLRPTTEQPAGEFVDDEADRPTVIAQKPAEKTGFFSRIASFDVGQAAKQAYQKAKEWGGVIFGVTAIAGGVAALESRTVDNQAKEPTSDNVPMGNSDMAITADMTQEALPAATVTVDTAGVSMNGSQDVPASWTKTDLGPSPELLVVSTPDNGSPSVDTGSAHTKHTRAFKESVKKLQSGGMTFARFDAPLRAEKEFITTLERHAREIGVTGTIDRNVAELFSQMSPEEMGAYLSAPPAKEKIVLERLIEKSELNSAKEAFRDTDI